MKNTELRAECPDCGVPAGAGDFNESTRCAYCRGCGKAFHFDSPGADLTKLPRGISIRDDGAGETMYFRYPWFITGLTGVAAFVWCSGLVWAWDLVAIRDFSWSTLLFALPFYLGGGYLLLFFLFLLFGRTEFRVRDDRLEFFRGFGCFGVRRYFEWDDITGIELEQIRDAEDASYCILSLRTDRGRKKLLRTNLESRLEFPAEFLRRHFNRKKRKK